MQRSRARTRRALPSGFGTLWVTVALDLVGFGIVIPVLARYAERFDASPATAGLIVASFSLAQLVFAPIWGAVSDRIGRKPVLIVSLVGTAVGSLLTGLAGSVGVLFLGRIVDGASGASVAVAQATVSDLADPDDQPRLMGYLGAAFGIGFIAGPVLGGLAALISPTAPFLVAAAIAGTNAIVAVFRLPSTPPDSAPIDEEAPEEDRPQLRRLLLVGFVSMVAFSGFEATFSLLVGSPEGRFEMTLSQVYAIFVAIGLAAALVQTRLVEPTVRRFGTGGTLRLALVCNCVGFVLLAAAVEPVMLLPALGVVVLGQGLISPTIATAVSGAAARRRRGRALGAQQSVGALARVIGPAGGGALFGLGVASPYLVAAGLALVAATLVVEPRDVAPVRT